MNLRRLRRAWKRRVGFPLRARFCPEIDLRIDHRTFRVNLRHHLIGQLLYFGEEYEPEFRRLMGLLELEGSVCLDIGANIGHHTLVLSELVGRTGKVLAFEPEAYNFQTLERNLRVNGAANVDARHTAVGDSVGQCGVRLNPHDYGDNRIAGPSSKADQVSAMTKIDASVADMPDGAIKLIKIDVQGYECHVMRGMQDTLRRNPDVVLTVEVFPDALRAAGESGAELVGMFRDLGMIGWELHEWRVLPIAEPCWYDMIFERHVDVVVSKNADRLRQAIGALYARPLPVPAAADRIGA